MRCVWCGYSAVTTIGVLTSPLMVPPSPSPADGTLCVLAAATLKALAGIAPLKGVTAFYPSLRTSAAPAICVARKKQITIFDLLDDELVPAVVRQQRPCLTALGRRR